MMMALLLIKSKIKNFYERHYRVVRGVIKMVAVFSSLYILVNPFHSDNLFSNPIVLLALSLLCGVTPDILSDLVIGFVICAQTFQISLLLTGCLLAILIIYMLLFLRLGEHQGLLLFSVPVLMTIHIGYAVPLIAALFLSPVAVPTILMGILLYYILQGIMEYSSMIGAADSDSVASSLHYLVDYLKQNQMMLITLAAFTLSFLCVYMIRRGKFRHGSQIGILVGAIVLMAVELICNIIGNLEIRTGLLTIQVLICVAAAYLVQFFRITLDYQGTKKLQFEDDEYYYYVTAVPKFKVAVVDRTVTRILSERKEEEE